MCISDKIDIVNIRGVEIEIHMMCVANSLSRSLRLSNAYEKHIERVYESLSRSLQQPIYILKVQLDNNVCI